MARAYTCDGCGVNIDKPKVVGRVLPRDYCDECAENAEIFLKSEEEQRARFHERFIENRKHLIEVHSKGGLFKLPDVA